MKKTIYLVVIIFTVLSLSSCSKDNNAKQDPVFQLPPETQVGANTFGVTIRGKGYIPRDRTGTGTGLPGKGIVFWGSPNNVSWNEIEIVDGASVVGFQMYIHLQNFNTIGVNTYILKLSNFHNNVDSTPFNHIYFKIWDPVISNYAYYGSIEDLGEVNITRNSGGIVSGNFKGKFVRYDNPNDYIDITEGRFDINTFTLQNHPFP